MPQQDDVGWLVKDFNVLYRVTRELLLAVGSGDEARTAAGLNEVARQLERLAPAYEMTEVAHGVGSFAAEVARGLDLTPEDIERAIAAHDAARRKASG